jgi:hypothetical protein
MYRSPYFSGFSIASHHAEWILSPQVSNTHNRIILLQIRDERKFSHDLGVIAGILG